VLEANRKEVTLKLNLVPARDGYHFTNTFVNHPVGGTPIQTYGLCGGMIMSALDYWRSGIPIPTHKPEDFGPDGVPAEGSRMRTYIYDRQMNSLLTNMMFSRWVVMPWFGPKDFHSWATGSEFNVVRQQIDRGRPAMLGLWSMTPGDPIGHQVLCYGYDYNPLRLYIYDPNKPDREVELVPVSPGAGCEMRVGGTRYATYRGYFWTDVYNWSEPPYRPRYHDVEVSSGLNLNPSGTNVPVGGPMESTVTIRNAGEYVARFRFPFIWVHGPAGQNLDSQSGLGGPEQNVTRLHPGEERTITRRSAQFGTEPGNYVVGVSYLSEQDHSRNIVTGPPGTTSARQVTLQRATTVVADVTNTVRESDMDVDTGVDVQPGDEFALTGTGSIWAGVWGTGQNGPEGWTDRIEQNPAFPMHGVPQAHPFALLGRFQGSGYFYVGRGLSRRGFTGATRQRLWLRINDNVPGNGTGAFQCRVQVWR